MFAITAKVKGIEITEGNYKNIKIVERHLRRLKKKYTGTTFKIDRVNKKDKKDSRKSRINTLLMKSKLPD